MTRPTPRERERGFTLIETIDVRGPDGRIVRTLEVVKRDPPNTP